MSSLLSFETAFVAAISPIVNGRVYPNTFPQPPALPIWPAVRYSITLADHDEDLCSSIDDGDGEIDNITVQFDLVAEDYFSARTLRREFRSAMKGLFPPAICSGESNVYDVETKVHRVILDYALFPSSEKE